MGRFGAHVVEGERRVKRQQALDAEIPLIDTRLDGIKIDGPEVSRGEIKCGWITPGRGKSILHKENRREAKGLRRSLQQVRWIEGQLVLAAEAIKQLIKPTVTCPKDGVLTGLVSHVDSRPPVAAVEMHKLP